MRKQFLVYILQCSDSSYYIGITNDLDRRISEHQSGAKKYSFTASRLPIQLVYSEVFNDPDTAIIREKQLKGWSHEKKKMLIENNQNEIFLHSRRKGK